MSLTILLVVYVNTSSYVGGERKPIEMTRKTVSMQRADLCLTLTQAQLTGWLLTLAYDLWKIQCEGSDVTIIYK